MKKLIALAFAMLFLGTGIASATDFSLTGSYFVRGTYEKNLSYNPATPNLDEGYGYWDMELSTDAKWMIDDTTFVTARFEMRDATWSTANSVTEAAAALQPDDNIIVEQVWAQHTFGSGLVLKVGLMPAGAWGSDFANTSDEAYRIFLTVPTSFGALLLIHERPDTQTGEQGNMTNGEDEDDKIYHLGLITKLGDIGVKPLFSYKDYSSDTAAADFQVFAAQVTIDGTFGAVGFETDFVYVNWDRNGGLVDYDQFGAYGNIWYQMDALKVGAFIAYGSYDEEADASFEMGDDFAPGGMMILGDDIFELTGAGNIGAGILAGLYGSYAVSDQLTLSACFAYAETERSATSAQAEWDGADMWELSAGFKYALTANLSYSGGIGFANLEYGDATTDPDTIWDAYHMMSFSF